MDAEAAALCSLDAMIALSAAAVAAAARASAVEAPATTADGMAAAQEARRAERGHADRPSTGKAGVDGDIAVMHGGAAGALRHQDAMDYVTRLGVAAAAGAGAAVSAVAHLPVEQRVTRRLMFNTPPSAPDGGWVPAERDARGAAGGSDKDGSDMDDAGVGS